MNQLLVYILYAVIPAAGVVFGLVIFIPFLRRFFGIFRLFGGEDDEGDVYESKRLDYRRQDTDWAKTKSDRKEKKERMDN